MSDFRLFCIVAFISCGLLAAADNHKLMQFNDRSAPFELGFVMACAVVAFFGKRT
jgi:hypothetical protein